MLQNHNTSFYFWSELLKPQYLEKSIKDLADYNFNLNYAIRPSILEKSRNIVNLCNDYDVELCFWPLLSYKEGYWVNSWNLSLQKKWMEKLMEEYPSVKTYILDLETPLNFKGINGKIKLRKLNQISPWRKTRDRLEEMITLFHNKGKQIISTNYPTNPSKRRKLGTPRPLNADYYSYMVYTSLFGLFGNDISKDNIIYYVGRKILETHGVKKGIIDLGLTSAGVLPNFLPLTTLERIESEISICKYLGFQRIHIFALDEIRKDVKIWMEKIISTKPKKPPIIELQKSGLIFKFFKRFLLSENLEFKI